MCYLSCMAPKGNGIMKDGTNFITNYYYINY